MLFVFYKAPDTRLVFAAFFFVALMFGMLRANWTQLTVLGFVSLAAFGAVAWARYLAAGDAEVLRLDMLQLLVTAVAFPWFVFIGGRVKALARGGPAQGRLPRDPLPRAAQPARADPRRHPNPAPPDGPAQAATVLPMMERQLQHLTRLLDDLLDVSRIARGKIALELEPIDLARGRAGGGGGQSGRSSSRCATSSRCPCPPSP